MKFNAYERQSRQLKRLRDKSHKSYRRGITTGWALGWIVAALFFVVAKHLRMF